MKQLLLLVLLNLVVLNTNLAEVTALELTTATTLASSNEEECDDLKEAAAKLKKQIAQIKEATAEGQPSELETLKAELDKHTKALVDFNAPKEGPGVPHGPEQQRKLKNLETSKDAARTAYYEKLAELKAKEDELLEKLRKLKKDCDKELTEIEHAELDQDIDDHDEAPAALEKQLKEQEEDATAEELERMEAELDKKEGESEEEYRARLRKYISKYPWHKLEKESGESRREFRKRKEKWEEKWRKDLWKKIQEEMRRRINEKIKESNDREKENPDDESALPQDSREENFYYSFRLGYAQGVFAKPFQRRLDEVSTLEDLQRSIYADPERFTALSEIIDGEFFLGTFSEPLTFFNRESTEEYRYGLSLSKGISPKLEVSIQLQYGRAEMSADFPVTVIGFMEINNQLITESYTFSKQAVRTQLGLNYRIDNHARWQPLVGAWLGAERQSWQSEVTIKSVNWELSNAVDMDWSYGLQAALRWQSSGLLFSSIRGQWGGAKGNISVGLGVSIGVRL